MDIKLKQIGTIYSPFKSLENMPVQPRGGKDIISTIKIKKEFEDGLKDLDGFSHLYLIYFFHKIEQHKLHVVPFNDLTHSKRGVFSTRTPMHPNSIGLSIVELVSVNENIITIKGSDVLDGTPLLDIKPYIENFDKIDTKTKSGWMVSTSDEVTNIRSDDRFVL
ncbi:MAG: tRNA (N6-threonylcarbamoyladenosine(37)-N6)-methyltransferase TrmO [Campylobacterota bacterium]|nr:tRNA (N6-threonylcarbamoyladenosine(37)-N6)-methyltransferase TrmO [Campylobacterota bacterium]